MLRTLVAIAAIVLIIAGVAFAWLISSMPSDTHPDVTRSKDAAKRGGYVAGASYLIPSGQFLWRSRLEGGRLRIQEFSLHDGPTLPSSREEYEREPGRWPDVVAVLGEGATIRVGKIVQHNMITQRFLEVTGEVSEDGRRYADVAWRQDFPMPGFAPKPVEPR